MSITLVTGGTGFIGSALVRLLAQRGERVRVPTRRMERHRLAEELDVELVEADLAEPEPCRRALDGCSRIYHLAGWISTRRADAEGVWRANVETSRNVLAAVVELKPERVVYLASIFALGGGSRRPVDETTRYNLGRSQMPYFRAKREAQLLVDEAVRTGAPIVHVYPTYCLGAGDWNESSAGSVLGYLRNPLGTYARGGINVVHVQDAARGLVLGMDRGEVGRRYLVGGDNVSWKELHGRAARLAGVREPRVALPGLAVRGVGALGERFQGVFPVDRGAAELLTQYWYYDDRRARDELGYHSRPLDETLRQSIEWYRAVGKLGRRGPEP